MLYRNIYSCLERFLETLPSVLYLPDAKETATRIHDELSVNLNNDYNFKVEIISLHDKLDKVYIDGMGEMSLVLIEFLKDETETNLKYFGVAFDDNEPNRSNPTNKPILDYFLSEKVDENKASFCQLFTLKSKLTLDRYNVEMNDSSESFIDTVADYLQDIELYKEVFTKIDENGKERRYQECGFRYAYEKRLVESKEIEEC